MSSDAHVFCVTIGMDALRVCLGQKPKNFTPEEIVRWIGMMTENKIKRTKKQWTSSAARSA